MLQYNLSQTSKYNSLPDVIQADIQLDAMGKAEMVSRLLSIMQRHNLHHSLCVRLLHKHSLINHGEIMGEELRFIEKNPLLVTHPISDGEVKSTFVPNSWYFHPSRGFEPFEYSHASLLHDPSITPVSNPIVFSELAECLVDLQLYDLLAIGLNYNDEIATLGGDHRTMLIETTDFEQRASVLRFVTNEDMAVTPSRETKWIASDDESPDNSPDDSPDKVKPVKPLCKCACSVFPEGGHQGTHICI